ncbi:hypothetical protein SB49_14120 [Sediminicola sp. YIK13]|uniref:hypothetical protein n=1 Tax=Sediminicola sp. YIK13 TaxID=1453352 RepID=UPI00072179A0|nr:hypothetical protein [Sediminicola sp. YIK13]ALM08804.1 hypothetical protein SB49_14120 [Sediminicola sp. YIK13]
MSVVIKTFAGLIFLILYSCVTPNQATTIYFKDGSQKFGFGLIKGNELIFKKTEKDKPVAYNFSSLDKVEMNPGKASSTYVLMPIKDKGDLVILEEIVVGAVSLYQSTAQSYRSDISNSTGNLGNAGGIGFAGGNFYNVNNFYLKREEETVVTHLGSNQLFSKNFGKVASEYFHDCPILLTKIESKEFKKRDLKQLVEYYNNQCN